MVWSISRVVLKAEGVRRRVPVGRVPADSWARGAQWRPARVQTPCYASRAASVSQSIVSARTESVPLCPSPV